MAIPEQAWWQAVDLLSRSPEVALACHVDPDGDALGSMLALQRALRAKGVRTVASWGTDDASYVSVPAHYSFLPDLETLVAATAFPSAPAVMVAFDTASLDRLGSLSASAEAAGTLIVIDHHATGRAFGDVQLVDGNVAATAVLVEELIARLDVELDTDTATCLYVGLVTDTGRFQHATTTPAVLELASRLVAAGVQPDRLGRLLWETHSFGYLKVLGRVLDRAELVPEAGLVWAAVRQSDLEELGVAWEETEGFIEVLRGVQAAACVMVCKEQPDGRWKASLRSRGGLDVGRLAGQLGGGGHTYAAGFVADPDVEKLVARVVELLTEEQAPATAAAGR